MIDAEVLEQFRSIVSDELDRRGITANDAPMTLAEAAKFLKVSRQTVCNMRKEGKLRPKRIGKRWRYSRADLLAALHTTRIRRLSGGRKVEEEPQVSEAGRNRGSAFY